MYRIPAAFLASFYNGPSRQPLSLSAWTSYVDGPKNQIKEKFHTIIAKALFVTKRSRPDIGLVVSVLSGRVRMPNKDDWRKMVRLVDYLEGTKELHLRLN